MQRVLDLDLLRTFVEVANTRSFTRAAHNLHRVQSAVSMQIKRLEELVGSPLLDRTTRRVTLTKSGELMLEHATRMLRLNEEALAELAAPELEGVVQIATSDTYAACFLPPVLHRFAQTYPRIRVELICEMCESGGEMLALVDSGEVDLALCTRPKGRRDGRHLRREPLVWVSAGSHQAHQTSPLPLALVTEGCPDRTAAVSALDKAGVDWRIAYTSPSHAGVLAAVSTGLAVTVVVERQLDLDSSLMRLGVADGFPKLPTLDVVLYRARSRPDHLVMKLYTDIVDYFITGNSVPS